MVQHLLSNSNTVNEQKLMNKLLAKNGRQGECQSDTNSKSNSQQETSFAQYDNKFCYFCGSKDHLSFDCSKKDKVPQDQWHVNTMHSQAQQLQPGTDDQQRNKDAAPNSNNCHDNTRSTTSSTSAAQTWYRSPPPRTGEVNCHTEMEETEYLLVLLKTR